MNNTILKVLATIEEINALPKMHLLNPTINLESKEKDGKQII